MGKKTLGNRGADGITFSALSFILFLLYCWDYYTNKCEIDCVCNMQLGNAKSMHNFGCQRHDYLGDVGLVWENYFRNFLIKSGIKCNK